MRPLFAHHRGIESTRRIGFLLGHNGLCHSTDVALLLPDYPEGDYHGGEEHDDDSDEVARGFVEGVGSEKTI